MLKNSKVTTEKNGFNWKHQTSLSVSETTVSDQNSRWLRGLQKCDARHCRVVPQHLPPWQALRTRARQDYWSRDRGVLWAAGLDEIPLSPGTSHRPCLRCPPAALAAGDRSGAAPLVARVDIKPSAADGPDIT